MKNLLFFLAFIYSTFSFSQLTVKPTSSGADSYIYVNDQVIFVNEELNLTRNGTANNQEASIYLRNNGQLIQGNNSALNSGSGQVSVQQNTPVTNQWAYYYWCSPIGNPGDALAPKPAGNRSFGVSFLYEPNPAVSPTAATKALTTTGLNGITAPFTISTRWLYIHPEPGTEAESDYVRIYAGNNAPPGFGFTMKGVGPIQTPTQLNQNYEFRGRPNNGQFLIPVAAPVLGEGQMTLSGNPYPSSLDLNKLFHDTGNESLGTFWYYDEDRTVASHYYTDKPYGYGVYSVGGKDMDANPANGPFGSYTAAPFYIYNAYGNQVGDEGFSTNVDQNKRFAPIGQGIMFVGESNGTVTIKNSHRLFYKEGNVGSVFHKTGPQEINDDVENEGDNQRNDETTSRPDYRDPQMRIYTIFNEAVTRDMLLIFNDQATDGYDRGMDGLSPLGLHTDAYFPVGTDVETFPYVINTVKYDTRKQIPITFKLRNQTKFAVKAVEEVKKPYNQAYLYDNQRHTYQQITNGHSASFNLPAGTYENRFFVVFRNPTLKRDMPLAQLEEKDLIMERVTFFQNNPVKQLEVLNPDNYKIKSATVYDMNGKLVINEKNLGDSNKYSFYTGNLSDGVYLVQLITSNDVMIDYKAIVHNK